MDIKKLLISFVTAFALTIVVSAIVTYIWDGAINWEKCVSFGDHSRYSLIMDVLNCRGN